MFHDAHSFGGRLQGFVGDNLDGSNDQMSNADTMFGCCSILKLLPSSEDADDSAAAPVVALAQSASRVSPLGAELLR